MKKAIIFILCMVLFLAPVLAIKPGTTFVVPTSGLLQITYPLFDYVKLNETFRFQFHIYDSNLSQLNTTVSCDLHIYNKSGNPILEQMKIPLDENGRDLYSNYTFTYTGAFDYILSCNSSSYERGFIEQPFIVTATGEALNDFAGLVLLVVSLLPILLAVLLFWGVSKLNDEHPALKWFAFLFMPIAYISTLHATTIIIIRYMNFTDLLDWIGDTTYWVYLLFFGLISYLCIYFIWKAIRKAAQDKEDNLEF